MPHLEDRECGQTMASILWARLAADLLTLCRLVGGLGITVWPWSWGPDAVRMLLKWNMLVWTTDVFDGPLARYSRTPPSRLGRAEQSIDLLVGWGTALALVRMGILPAWALVTWGVLFAIAHVFRPTAATRLGFMLPLVILPPVVGFLHAPPQGWIYLLWIVLMAVVAWNRLKEVIESFVEGLPDAARRWVWSWLPEWARPPRRPFENLPG